MQVNWDDFEKIEIRAGLILEAKEAVGAKKPAYQLLIDFGPLIGKKKSSAQITKLYSCDELVGKTIIAVTNFMPKQIGNFISEVLVLGLSDSHGDIILLTTEREVPLGSSVF